MDRTLTTLARARYRPARLSVLSPLALAAAGAERLARDVSLRWEEAAEAFLEGLRAPGRGRDFDRFPGPDAGAGGDARPDGSPGADGARVRSRRGEPGETAPWRRAPPDLEDGRVEGAPFPIAAEGRPAGGVDVPLPRGPGEVEAGPPHARPLIDGPGEDGGWPDGEAPGEDFPARSGAGPLRNDGLDAPRRAADARPGRDPPPLARPRAVVQTTAGAPARRARAEPVPGAGPARARGIPAAFVEPSRPRPRPVMPAESAAAGRPRETGGLASLSREDADLAVPDRGGLDSLALESLLDERRRRDAALEEWEGTGY